jgi:hypothetical protein
MKTRLLALALAVAFVPVAQAQYDDYDYGYDYDYDGYAYDYDDYAPLTGDSTLDAILAALNAAFADEPEYYSQQIVQETRLQPVIVQDYIVQRRYAPSDVYMMGELAQASGKSFADVARAYDANRAQGWGATARSLGIKPGSAQFHALKNGSTGIVQRGKGRGRANAPGQQRRTVAVQGGQPSQAQGHPAKGAGKAKGNKGGNGKGKGKGKNK